MDDKLFLLSQISLLEELPKEELLQVERMTLAKPIKKGTFISSPSAPLSALFLLKFGQVRLYRMNSTGKQFTVDILTDGNVFGETSSLTLTDNDLYIEAMTDCYLCVLGKKDFEELLERNPTIALKFISILSQRLTELYSLTEKIALADVKYRILYLLVKLSEKTGIRKKDWQSIKLRLTHQDIANMVGSSRETTSSIMSQLKKEGVIKKGIHLQVHADKAYDILAAVES
ncbi:cAMP-binding protein [Bacillus coahuilensis p1.1.43]|uniref:cAMP-binding protein n=1 Tax=Bacillus coahuilensis p1.1.43 TaxID=1150625 RepID=A0A147K5J8_9BACI|nr:Crp/Fnr family transcriptional regulator [Bacillus coahuilensis]KUP04892.1 cAMP-binding protein [Bacillus coahuilensis p1.1.43]